MKNENYLTIQGWMINELDLSGNDLLCYAIINGFSQDGDSSFTGSSTYLSDSMNCSKPTVFKSLKSLMDKGYIKKEELYKYGSKFCEYYVSFTGGKESLRTTIEGIKKLNDPVKKLNTSHKESLHPPSKETLPNTITINTIDNTIIKKEERFNFRKELINYGFKENVISDWLEVRKKRKSSNTQTAFKAFINKINKSKHNKDYILETVVENSWVSFQEDWIDNIQPKTNIKKTQDQTFKDIWANMPSQQIGK